MKKSKIALSFLLVISLFYSSNVYATTNFDNIESSENVILPSSIPTIDWKLLFNAV